MILRDNKLYSSYSQIDNFMQCPMKWYLDKVMGLKQDVPNKHLFYGLVVHEFLEELFNTKMVHEDLFHSRYDIREAPIQDYLTVMEKKLDKKKIPFVSENEKQEYYEQAFSMIRYLYETRDYFTNLLFNSEIIGAELPFSIEIDIPTRKVTNENGDILTLDTVNVTGSIDLVLQTEIGIVGIDYKTSSKKFDKSKLKHNLQFPIYSKAIYQEFGEYPVENYYFFTKLLDYQKVLFTPELTSEQEENMNKRGSKEIYSLTPDLAENTIKNVFKEMGKTKQRACPTALCYWCDFGKSNTKICKYSSNWTPKDKK